MDEQIKAVRRSGGRAVGALLVALMVTALPAYRLNAQSAGGRPSALVTGYLQARFETIGDSGRFSIRRARFGAQGTLNPWVSYKVQFELWTKGTASVSATDLYLVLSRRAWSLTAGQFKVPFSRELLMSSTTLELGERTLIVEALAPARDVGAMASWQRPRVTAQVGVFNGDGDNVFGNPDNRMMAVGRMVAMPLTGLEVGIAGARDTNGDPRWGAEVQYARPRGRIRAEFLASNALEGGYLLGAYRPGIGRSELVGRVEQYQPLSPGADRVRGVSGGIQYLFNADDLKLQANYTVLDEEGAAVANNRFIVQMQVRW